MTTINGSEELHHCDVDDKRETTLAEGIAIFIAVVTILFNAVILLAIVKGPSSLKKPPYWFIASLAAADLLTGAEVVTAIVVPVGTSPLSRIVLKGIAVVTFIASINSLTLVSFDRFVRIRHYAKYEQVLNERRAFLLIVASWIVAFSVFLFIPLASWSCADVMCCARDGLCVCAPGHDAECSSRCSLTFVPFTKGYLIVGVCYFILSIIVMLVFYALLFRVVKKRTFERTPSTNSNSKQGSVRGNSGTGGPKKVTKTSKREIRLAKTLAITLGIFVFCWFPVIVLFFVDILSTSKTDLTLQKAFDLCLIPSVINSCLNPVIYAYRIPKMKQTVERNICSLLCVSTSSNSSFYNRSQATSNSSTNQQVRKRSTKRTTRVNNQQQQAEMTSENSTMMATGGGGNSVAPVLAVPTAPVKTLQAVVVTAGNKNNNNNYKSAERSLSSGGDDLDLDEEEEGSSTSVSDHCSSLYKESSA